MRYADGGVFDGLWEKDHRHGSGHMTYKDGASYQGDWKDDSRFGDGILHLANGSNYKGEFRNDIPEGDGTLNDVDEQSTYMGQFKAGLRSGTGKCEYHKTGDKFSGEWEDGVRVNGVMFLADGEVERVGYLNDKVIRREKLSEREQRRLLARENGETSPKASSRQASKEEPPADPAPAAKLADGPPEPVGV